VGGTRTPQRGSVVPSASHRRGPLGLRTFSLLLEPPRAPAPPLEVLDTSAADPDVHPPGPPARPRHRTLIVIAIMSVALAGIGVTVAFGSLLRPHAPAPSAGRDYNWPALSLSHMPPATRPAPRRPEPSPVRARNRRQQAAPAPRVVPSPPPAHGGGGRPPPVPRDDNVARPALMVNFVVHSGAAGTFQGQFDIVNNGTRPIAGWEIAILLPGDDVLSATNARVSSSDGTLLFDPLDAAEVVRPHGGTLRVSFTAKGTQTNPQGCAFDETACG
jgi:hypothetical protein